MTSPEMNQIFFSGQQGPRLFDARGKLPADRNSANDRCHRKVRGNDEAANFSIEIDWSAAS